MRPFSRTIPKSVAPKPLSGLGKIVTLSIISTLACGVAVFAWNYFIISIAILGVAALEWKSIIKQKRRLQQWSIERQGMSICDFARAFNRKSVDPYIIRAVYEELHDYLKLEDLSIPILPEDDLFKDYQMDPDDLDLDMAETIAFRTGRSLDGFEKNPLVGNVNIVRDLVMFFNAQPMQKSAG